jgi:homoserine O-succinyltransferase
MPLVANSDLPTFTHLRQRGHPVLALEEALHQDIRELHIGLLNMMPDAALAVTEQQFMRLVGNSNQIVQFHVHPFSLPGLSRSAEAEAHIGRYYTTFDRLRQEGLDALIITGANVSNPLLQQEPFWQPLQEVMEWAAQSVTSVLCSCLATHALMKHFYGIDRVRLPAKRWGVYEHRIIRPDHPLLRDINTRFDVPHSRHNAITREQFLDAGLNVLVESANNGDGVHLAASPDQFRIIYMQGHPEYDTNSLLKEYKREVLRHLAGEREDWPPYPEHYFSPEAVAVLEGYRKSAETARRTGNPLPDFPETTLQPLLENTWGDTGKALFNNWLGLVYRLTHLDRHKLFMDHVDPHNPLGLR